MAKRSKRGPRQGSNPARVAAMQDRLRSGAYGTHKQSTDRPRREVERDEIDSYEDD